MERSFNDAVEWCHVRSAIYRTAKPEKKYWKNSFTPLKEQVPLEEQQFNDWQEYDPREDDDSSLFMFND